MVLDQSKSSQSDHQHSFNSTISHKPTDEVDGFFPSESLICRIDQEALLLLGSGRTILLQLAHPLVAVGVADYSDFQSDPLARLFRTTIFMHTILFENRRRAREALHRFHTLHAHIRGHLQHAAGPYPAGTPYSGTEPELKLWVYATFIDTSLKTYEQFVTPLTPEERQNYYSDNLTLAGLLDIPHEILPKTLKDFRYYMASMLTSDTLSVTNIARRLAKDILYPRVGIVPAASAGLLRFVTAGLLSERLRTDYGLKWGRRRQFLLNRLSSATRFLRPRVPPWVWQSPHLGGGLSRLLLWGTMPSQKKY